MSGELNNTRTHRLLVTVIVLLGVTVAMQAALLVHSAISGDNPGRLAHWVASLWPGRRLEPRAAAPDAVWNDSKQVEQLHAQIRRMFDQAFNQNRLAPPLTTDTNAAAPSEPRGMDPFEHMRRMQAQVDALFARAQQDFERFSPPLPFDEGWAGLEVTPAMNVHEDADAYHVTIHAPSITKQSIRVTLSGSILTISASATDTNAGVAGAETTSRAFSFERRLYLPRATAHPRDVKAAYNDGTLEVIVPKAAEGETAEPPIPVE